VKQLMNTMVFGLKTVAWCISNYRGSGKRLQMMDEEECGILAHFLDNGLKCFRVYSIASPLTTKGAEGKGEKDKDGNSPSPEPSKSGVATPKDGTAKGGKAGKSAQQHSEEKDVLEHFASVFTVLDIRSFRDVFSVQMGTLFDQIVANHQLPMLIIPQHFLSSNNVSKSFADILLSFLIKRMDKMAAPPPAASKDKDTPNSEATVMLNLFRIVFSSVTLFPENEAVLRPYLNTIVSESMKFAMEVPKTHTHTHTRTHTHTLRHTRTHTHTHTRPRTRTAPMYHHMRATSWS
jgi:transformation/transcription domain-associated protein